MEQGAAAREFWAPKLTATNIILGIIQVSFLQRYFNAGGCRWDKYGQGMRFVWAENIKDNDLSCTPAAVLHAAVLHAAG